MGQGNGTTHVDALFGASISKVEIWNHAISIIRKQERQPTLDVHVFEMSRQGPYWVVSVKYVIKGSRVHRQIFVSESLLDAA